MNRSWFAWLQAMLFCALFQAGARADFDLKWHAKTEHEAYLPGEPVVVQLTIHNDGLSSGALMLGTSHLDNLAFTLARADDLQTTVASGWLHPVRFDDMTLGAPPELLPHTNTLHEVVLNRWLSTRLPAGLYRVTCHVIGSSILEMPPSSTKQLAVSHDLSSVRIVFDLQILPADEGVLEARLDWLMSEFESLNRHAPALMLDQLRFAEHASLLEFKLREVKRSNLRDRMDLIGSIARLRTQCSRDALQNFLASDTVVFGEMRQRIQNLLAETEGFSMQQSP